MTGQTEKPSPEGGSFDSTSLDLRGAQGVQVGNGTNVQIQMITSSSIDEIDKAREKVNSLLARLERLVAELDGDAESDRPGVIGQVDVFQQRTGDPEEALSRQDDEDADLLHKAIIELRLLADEKRVELDQMRGADQEESHSAAELDRKVRQARIDAESAAARIRELADHAIIDGAAPPHELLARVPQSRLASRTPLYATTGPFPRRAFSTLLAIIFPGGCWLTWTAFDLRWSSEVSTPLDVDDASPFGIILAVFIAATAISWLMATILQFQRSIQVTRNTLDLGNGSEPIRWSEIREIRFYSPEVHPTIPPTLPAKPVLCLVTRQAEAIPVVPLSRRQTGVILVVPPSSFDWDSFERAVCTAASNVATAKIDTR